MSFIYQGPNVATVTLTEDYLIPQVICLTQCQNLPLIKGVLVIKAQGACQETCFLWACESQEMLPNQMLKSHTEAGCLSSLIPKPKKQRICFLRATAFPSELNSKRQVLNSVYVHHHFSLESNLDLKYQKHRLLAEVIERKYL